MNGKSPRNAAWFMTKKQVKPTPQTLNIQCRRLDEA